MIPKYGHTEQQGGTAWDEKYGGSREKYSSSSPYKYSRFSANLATLKAGEVIRVHV